MYKIIIRESVISNGQFTYSRSPGAGGQNVNKVNSKVTLHLPLSYLNFLKEDEVARLRESLKNRINSEDEIVISSSRERSQSLNRSITINKCVDLIEKGIVKKKTRKKTKPSRGSVKRRLEAKKKHSLKKQIRNTKVAY